MNLSSFDRLHLSHRMAEYEARGSRQWVRLVTLIASIRPLRNRTIRLVCRMEGGQIWSAGFRELMHRHYGVEIGQYSYGSCLWPSRLPQGTRVGNFCSIAGGVQVFRRNHPVERFSQHPFFYNKHCGLLKEDAIIPVADHPLEISHDSWIGANVIITPRCSRIGEGAVVAAGAVVTSDVPGFSIVAGNPARIIRKRFSDEICAMLLESRWWEYRLAQLVPMLTLFLEEATLENAKQLCEHLRDQAPGMT